jgi:hypothetical protein
MTKNLTYARFILNLIGFFDFVTPETGMLLELAHAVIRADCYF